MFCTNCGKSIPEGNAFCTGCGKPVASVTLEPDQTAVLDQTPVVVPGLEHNQASELESERTTVLLDTVPVSAPEADVESSLEGDFEYRNDPVWDLQATEAFEPVHEEVLSFCMTCGSPLEPGSAFCIQCGSPAPRVGGVTAPLTQNTNAANVYYGDPAAGGFVQVSPGGKHVSDAPQGKGKGKIIGIVVAIVLVLAIAGAAAFFLLGSGSKSSQSADSQTPEQPAQMAEDKSGSQESEAPKYETTIPEVTFDVSQPFWGAWVSFASTEKEANDLVSKLSQDGIEAQVVKTSEWSGLSKRAEYGVTAGTWKSFEEADKMVSALTERGYKNAAALFTDEKIEEGAVQLTVQTQDGKTLSGTVRRDADGYVVADSSTREYSIEEIRALGLTDAELCIAWNEPFARQGYHFKNSALQAYFESCPWYVDSGSSANLTGVAAKNNENFREVATTYSSESDLWKDLSKN